MRFVLPIARSDESTLSKIAGNLAAIHNPNDVYKQAYLINTRLEDKVLINHTRNAGLAQAAKFSWSRFTQQTMSVCQFVLSS